MTNAARSALVIGGTGFIGHKVVEALVNAGYSVHSMSRFSENAVAHSNLLVDRSDTEKLNDLTQDLHFNLVVDTCAMSKKNIDSLCASDLMDRFDHWVHISSGAIYSDTNLGSFDEADPTGGATHWGDYGCDKDDVETVLLEIFEANERRLTMLRPPYVYGPKNSSHRESFVWDCILKDRAIPVPKKACSVQFIYSGDLAAAIVQIDRNETAERIDVLNIAHEECVDFMQFCRAAVTAFGETDWEFKTVDAEALGIKTREFFPFRTENLCLNVSALNSKYDTSKFLNLEVGLRRTFSES